MTFAFPVKKRWGEAQLRYSLPLFPQIGLYIPISGPEFLFFCFANFQRVRLFLVQLSSTSSVDLTSNEEYSKTTLFPWGGEESRDVEISTLLIQKLQLKR